MSYDPFVRGPAPVGVRTLALTDRARDDRPLPVEVWYPATDAHGGADQAAATQDTYEVLPGFPPVTQEAVRDAAPRPGSYPLVMFSHQTYLCIRGLGVAHLDAALRAHEGAAQLLEGDVRGALAERGVRIAVY